MLSLILYIAGLFTAAGAGVLAAQTDWKGLKIPNQYPLVIMGAFVIAFSGDFLGGGNVFSAFYWHLLAGLIVFVVTYILFVTIRFGGGDAKLLTVFALWFTPMQLGAFLFYTTLTGAVLALVALSFKKYAFAKEPAEGSWFARLKEGDNSVPYGIAITTGAILAFLVEGYIAPGTLKCFVETSCS